MSIINMLLGSGGQSFISATGGTITTDGNFKVHTFTSTGTFEIASGTGDVEYLVVAGGGGGGQTNTFNAGGGGGAGGFLTGTLTNQTVGSLAVEVGAGGQSAQPGAASGLPEGAGKVIDKATAQQFYRQAGNDPDKARQLAIQNGWKLQ